MNLPTTCPPALEGYLDIPVKLIVELGDCFKSTQEMSRLDIGSVVALDQRSGGQVNLYAGQRLVAKGEIVMVDGALVIKVISVNR